MLIPENLSPKYQGKLSSADLKYLNFMREPLEYS